MQPCRSPARPAPLPPEARAAARAAVTVLMGDANLVFDRHLQASQKEKLARPRDTLTHPKLHSKYPASARSPHSNPLS
jgi:hypothetical protein